MPRDPGSPLEQEAQPSLDVELLQATLEVHREFLLKDQLRALLGRAGEWTGASCGFALGGGEEGRSWSPIASTLPADDPRVVAFSSVDPRRLRRWLEDTPTMFDGFGPLSPIVERWPGQPPAHCVAAPGLTTAGEWAAALVLLFENRPPASDLGRLGQLMMALRPAFHNAMQLLSMRELVIKDDTAHCFNRRYFESSLPEELARANRFHAALSLIFLDMDNLKEVNRRHGHAMGSRTLHEVSRRVRAKIRRFDKLFRFGGDEFCIVLPETEWHGALEVAERVRDAIANKPFLVRELGEPDGIRMTASLGIASFPLHARNQKELIEYADRAMQRIKAGTKNSIGIAEIMGEDHGG